MAESTPTPNPAILVPATVTVADFAARLKSTPAQIVGALMKNGVMATINEQIDFDTASIIAVELGYEIELEPVAAELRPSSNQDDDANIEMGDRPPVVAVMGHVDHGKTSLLDAIRNTEVAASESGGITQHIGAYQIHKNDRLVTFLDTPGHEAFHAIRVHGVRITDVVVIVVAADDGVKPQTKEAVRLAQEAGAGIVVAISKIDKPDADVNRVKQQLGEIGIIPDDWGGDVPTVEISSKSGVGIDQLVDMVLLVSDLDVPQARQSGPARGVIIESNIVTGRGPVATALVEDGTLSQNQYIVAGSTYAKIKSLEDYTGKRIKSATPGTPVVVSGFKDVPAFGDWFEVVETEKAAREWLTARQRDSSIKSLMRPKSVSAGDLARAVTDGRVKEVTVLLKADAQGSVESLTQALEGIGNDEVRVKIVQANVGDITENDINTAAATGALVLGFHVGIAGAVTQLAKRSNVNYQIYKVIYELLDDVRGWLNTLLEPEIVETEIGKLELLAVFKTTKDKVICGGKMLKGKVEPGVTAHVKRGKEDIGEALVVEVKKGAETVTSAMEEEECGLLLERTLVPEAGDTLTFIRRESVARSL
jgi:translation initiation factor IF-2